MIINNLINDFVNANDNALLSTKIVSAYMGLSLSWYNVKAVTGGGIPYRKIGNKRLYQKKDVLDWIANNSKKVTSTSQYDKRGAND